jgi:hypothetical protein
VIVAGYGTVAGAVYTPALSVPTAGDNVHVNAVFDEPSTVPSKVTLSSGCIVTVAGVSATLTVGTSVTVAEALFVPSATLVAVTVTVCPVEIVAGAVY